MFICKHAGMANFSTCVSYINVLLMLHSNLKKTMLQMCRWHASLQAVVDLVMVVNLACACFVHLGLRIGGSRLLRVEGQRGRDIADWLSSFSVEGLPLSSAVAIYCWSACP